MNVKTALILVLLVTGLNSARSEGAEEEHWYDWPRITTNHGELPDYLREVSCPAAIETHFPRAALNKVAGFRLRSVDIKEEWADYSKRCGGQFVRPKPNQCSYYVGCNDCFLWTANNRKRLCDHIDVMNDIYSIDISYKKRDKKEEQKQLNLHNKLMLTPFGQRVYDDFGPATATEGVAVRLQLAAARGGFDKTTCNETIFNSGSACQSGTRVVMICADDYFWVEGLDKQKVREFAAVASEQGKCQDPNLKISPMEPPPTTTPTPLPPTSPESPQIFSLTPNSLQAGVETPPDCWQKPVPCQKSQFKDRTETFVITGKNLSGTTLESALSSTHLRFENVQISPRGDKMTGVLIVTPEAPEGTYQVRVIGSKGRASASIEVWISGTQYLRRAFKSEKRVDITGTWLERVSDSVRGIEPQLRKGLAFVNRNPYKTLRAVYQIYDQKTFQMNETLATGQAGHLAAYVMNCQREVPVRGDVSDLAETILHESAHLLHCDLNGALGLTGRTLTDKLRTTMSYIAGFQGKWSRAAGDLGACPFLPLTDEGGWKGSRGDVELVRNGKVVAHGDTRTPRCGFYDSYGASDALAGKFSEDVATLTSASVFDPGFIDRPNVNPDYKDTYRKKLALLKEYGFIP